MLVLVLVLLLVLVLVAAVDVRVDVAVEVTDVVTVAEAVDVCDDVADAEAVDVCEVVADAVGVVVAVVVWDDVTVDDAVLVGVVVGDVFSQPCHVPSACLSAISFRAFSGSVQSPSILRWPNTQAKSKTPPWLPWSNCVISLVIFSSATAVSLQS